MSGSCVTKEPLPNAVDGGWSEWGLEYGECSRTCGGGVRMRRRYCNNPTPRYGGISCIGSAEQYQACNLTVSTLLELSMKTIACLCLST